MKNAVILHGTVFNSGDPTTNNNWFPWLKTELETKGYQVFLPELPNPDKPNAKTYTKLLFDNWDFNEETVVIGHSSGATACLWVAQELPVGSKLKQLICVAPFYTGLDGSENYKDIAEYEYNWKKISESAEEITVIYSDDDPYISQSEMEFIAEHIGAEKLLIPGQKHFSLGYGEKYRKFPELLSLILPK